jgi:hypothetical protein
LAASFHLGGGRGYFEIVARLQLVAGLHVAPGLAGGNHAADGGVALDILCLRNACG